MKNLITILCVMGLLFVFTFAGILSNLNTQNKVKDDSGSIQDNKNDLANTNSKMRKIWVFFKDKGFKDHLNYEHALATMANKLTQGSIERRKKVLRKDNIITFEDVPVCEDYITKVKQLGVKIRTKSRWLNAISVEANTEQIDKIREFPFINEIKDVAVFRSQKPMEIEETRSSQYVISKVNNYNFNYGLSFDQLQHIRVPEVHQMGLSGKGVLICIMDTGFRKDHEVFQYVNIVAERDFIFNDDDTQTDPNNPFDSSDRHGTFTWSNLAGFKEGKLIGPAFGADFLLAKTEYTLSERMVEEDYWVAAAEWADSLGAQVISSSLGYTKWYTIEDLDGNTATITKAADRAVKLGIVVVTSAGNERTTYWGYISPPADGDSVIAVGAYNIYFDALAFFSSPGPTYDGRIKPEVCASGVNNYSADNRSISNYKRVSGTSLSCPLVAGVTALILEQHPTWTPIDVRNALMYTASQHELPDNDLGWGIVDAYKAVFDTAATISVQNITYDDDNIGKSQGNSNNLPEPAETIELSGTLSCRGKIEQSKYSISLSTNDPFIKLSDSIEYVEGLVSYGKVEITNAFSFTIDQNTPENHLAEFYFTIKDELNNTWEQVLAMKVVIQRSIAGTVSSAATGYGIDNAIVTWTKLDNESNRIIEIDTVRTEANGNYTLSLVGGDYAVQVYANGYSSEDASILSIPEEISQLDFYLNIADFQIYPYSFRIDIIPGSEFVETLEISNTGNIPLFYNIQEKNPLSSSSNKSFTKPEILLRSDPNDGISYDLKEVFCKSNSQRLFLKITTYQEIVSNNQWNISVFLDTDFDQKTGYKVAGIGADYQISYVKSRVNLSKYNNGLWENKNFSASTSSGKKQFTFIFDPSLIGNPEIFSLAVMLHEDDTSDSCITRDIIPDDGGLSKVIFSRYKSDWLTIEKPYNIVPPGTSDNVQLIISFPDSVEEYYGTELILSTNSPKYGETAIPIYLGDIKGDINTDIANNHKLPTHFDLDQNYPNPFNSQTKIRFSLPYSSKVNLMVVNSLGQNVITLYSSELIAGFHTLYWDGRNEERVDVSSGIYFIKLEAGKWNKIIKAILLR